MGFFRYIRDENGEKTHFCIGKLKIKIDKSGANYYSSPRKMKYNPSSSYSGHGSSSGPSYNTSGTPMLGSGSSVDVSGKSYGSR
jgi:hypothetical protein